MDDRELCEHTYSIKGPWFVSRVSVSDSERRVDFYLSHEKSVRWPCPVCEKLLSVSDHVKERAHVRESHCAGNTIPRPC